MPILFDTDPERGIKEYWDYDPINDTFSIITEQDVSGFLDKMKDVRNDPTISSKGIKEDWWYYASIPEVVELDLLKRGLSLYDKNHTKDILKVINTEYPYLKATDKTHR
jgi:hypothetical protein